MCKASFWGIFLLVISINSGIAQNKHKMNILECMEIIDFDIHTYVQADIFLERSYKVVDVKSGFYEVKIDHGGDELMLCQVAKYDNHDGTILLAVSGYFADEQCSNRPFYFYEISESGDSFKLIDKKSILSTLDISMYLKDSKPIQLLEKYLPALKASYLGSQASIQDLLNEVYDIHLLLPRKGTKTNVTLTTCDYIPRNEVSISYEDWNIVENAFMELEMVYDKDQKRFRLEK